MALTTTTTFIVKIEKLSQLLLPRRRRPLMLRVDIYVYKVPSARTPVGASHLFSRNCCRSHGPSCNKVTWSILYFLSSVARLPVCSRACSRLSSREISSKALSSLSSAFEKTLLFFALHSLFSFFHFLLCTSSSVISIWFSG